MASLAQPDLRYKSVVTRTFKKKASVKNLVYKCHVLLVSGMPNSRESKSPLEACLYTSVNISVCEGIRLGASCPASLQIAPELFFSLVSC